MLRHNQLRTGQIVLVAQEARVLVGVHDHGSRIADRIDAAHLATVARNVTEEDGCSGAGNITCVSITILHLISFSYITVLIDQHANADA